MKGCCSSSFNYLLFILPLRWSHRRNKASYDYITHLSFSDLAVDNVVSPSVISLNIQCSKTDQGRVGCQVILGKTGDVLCPIMALLDYLTRRGGKPEALFQWQNGTPLSKTWFVEAIRQALTAARLSARDYVGYSFGIGSAKTAAMAGLRLTISNSGAMEKSIMPAIYQDGSPSISYSIFLPVNM